MNADKRIFLPIGTVDLPAGEHVLPAEQVQPLIDAGLATELPYASDSEDRQSEGGRVPRKTN